MSGAPHLTVTLRARRYLEALSWDGTARLTSVATDVLGASRRSFASIYVARTIVGAVARAFVPGCTLGGMLVLCGAQGGGKSRFLAALAGGELFGTYSAGRGVRAFQDAWIVEVPALEDELSTDRRGIFKASLVAQSDAPGLDDPLHQRRSRPSVAIGSSNAPSFWIEEPTRRFWPVQVGAIDVERMVATRDQVFAEAVTAYRNGDRWWLDAQAGAA